MTTGTEPPSAGPPPSRWVARLLPTLVAAILLGLGAVIVSLGLRGAATPGAAVATSAGIGGPFQLTSHAGERFPSARLAGRPYAVFFGFTHCPDVCPTALFEMSQALTALGPDAARLSMLFVSVDPERDTPQQLQRYLSSFDPRIVGLTGTPEEIAAVVKAYRVYARKVPIEGGDYTLDHTASILLMDAAGNLKSTLSSQETAPVRLAKLRALIAGAA